jgi:hypothetical protein
MAIYTRYGVEVRIVGAADFDVMGLVKVQDVRQPEWVRDRHVSELRADGGIQEIVQAAEAAKVAGGGIMPLPT